MEPLNRYGFQIQALGCWLGDRLVGGALFRTYSVPLTPITVTECLDGPIFQEWEAGWADPFVAGISSLALTAGSTVLVIQDCSHPEVHRDVTATLHRLGHKMTLKPGRSDAVLPLRGRTMEEIWKGFNHGTRQRIKKARANGLTVRRLSRPEDLVQAYGAWLATAHRKSFSDVRPWGSLEPVIRQCLDQNKGSVLATYYGETLLAAAFITHIGDTAAYVYGGYVDGAQKHSPTHVLQYEAIRESLERGLAAYNFGGLLSLTEPEAHGVDEFKLGFGAAPRQRSETIVWRRNPVRYALMEGLRRGPIGRILESTMKQQLIRRGERGTGAALSS
jgi:hypothetical protein